MYSTQRPGEWSGAAGETDLQSLPPNSVDHKSLDHRCQSGRLLQKTLVVEHDDANMVTSIRLGTEVSGGQCDLLPQPSEEETPEAHTPQSQGNVANVSTAAGSSAQNQEQDQVHVAQAIRLLEQNPKLPITCLLSSGRAMPV
ncbi:hypothetical protein MHYP_G00310020 [Metynnis hypsauchen]